MESPEKWPKARLEEWHRPYLRYSRYVIALAGAGLVILTSHAARADTQTWSPGGATGGNGTWDSGVTADWAGGQTWSDFNDALFTGTGGTITVVTPTANSLTFSASGAYLLKSGTLTLSGSDVTANSPVTISSAFTGMAGLFKSGTATETLSGQDDFGVSDVTIHRGAIGIPAAGSLSDEDGIVGDAAGSGATITVGGAAATWANNGDLYVGQSGTGTLQVSAGGTVSTGLSGALGGVIGDNPGASGTVTVSGAGASWSNDSDLYVGNSGTGALTISAGGSVTDDDVIGNLGGTIGEGAGSNGAVTVTGAGSTWTDNGDLYIGDSGTGSLQVAAGGVLSNAFTTVGAVIGNNAGSNGTVTITGHNSTWTDSGDLYVGDSGTGALMVESGGTLSTSDNLIGAAIGETAGSIGTATVTGAGSNWTDSGDLFIGDNGTGTLFISSDASVSTGEDGSLGGVIGNNAGSNGAVSVTGTGSKWTNSYDLYVGNSGTGSLQILSGASVSNGLFRIGATIGEAAGSSGSVTVSGTGSTWTDAGDLYIGDSGTGSLTISGDASVTNDDNTIGASIGEAAGAAGIVTVTGTGSKWTDGGDLFIGDNGSGTLTISSGALVTNSDNTIGAAIGEDVGSSGMATVSGTNSKWTDNGDLFIGDSGTGTLLISAGAVVTDAFSAKGGAIGEAAGATGAVTVTGTGSKWADGGDLYVGDSGIGSLQITGAGLVTSGSDNIGATIGEQSGATGSVVVSGSGSKWTASSDLYVGDFGAGTLRITSGGVVTDIDGFIGDNFGATGIAALSGTGSTWTSSASLWVGGSAILQGGRGFLSVTNGATVSATQTTIWSTGAIGFGENPVIKGPLIVDGGTVTLVDGVLQTVTLTNAVTVDGGSNLGFEIGNGSDKLAFSGAGSITVTGFGTISLYGISGQVTTGTDVLVAANTSGAFSIGTVYNTGNFTYSLVSTATSENVIVTATTPLTTAYWKGSHGNVWSALIGGTGSNWTTDAAGTTDPLLTPSAGTDVVFSATGAANQAATVLESNMTIKSLTISDPNAVSISGSETNPLLGSDTLTLSGTSGSTGITINPGSGAVTIGANLILSGSSQTITVNNAAGLLVSGTLGSSGGLVKSGTGILTLAGIGTYAGPTTVKSGNVLVTGSLSGTVSASVASGAGLEVDGLLNLSATTAVSGTLSGIGSLGAVNVASGGFMDPGLTSAAAQALGLALRILTGGASASPHALAYRPTPLILVSREVPGDTEAGPELPLEDSLEAPGPAVSLATPAASSQPDLAASPAAGALTADGNVTLAPGAIFSIRIGVVSATDNDQLIIANGGAVALNGATLQLTIGSVLNNPASVGLTYIIINGGAADTGVGFGNTFAQGTSIITPGGYKFNILYASNPAGTGAGSDVVLELTAIPEPGACALLACGVGILMLRRRIG